MKREKGKKPKEKLLEKKQKQKPGNKSQNWENRPPFFCEKGKTDRLLRQRVCYCQPMVHTLTYRPIVTPTVLDASRGFKSRQLSIL